MILSRESHTKMDANPSHQTNSVNISNDCKDVGNIIDMGSITILIVWFNYNCLIIRQ